MRHVRAALLAAVVLATAGAAGCTNDNGGALDPSPTTGGAAPGQLVIEGSKFPEPMTAVAGTTVTIVDKDSVPHTLTADDDSFTASVRAGATAPLSVPAEPGRYPVHCNVHPTMKGTLVVTG